MYRRPCPVWIRDQEAPVGVPAEELNACVELDFPGVGHQERRQPPERRRVGVDLGARRVGASELGVQLELDRAPAVPHVERIRVDSDPAANAPVEDLAHPAVGVGHVQQG